MQVDDVVMNMYVCSGGCTISYYMHVPLLEDVPYYTDMHKPLTIIIDMHMSLVKDVQVEDHNYRHIC